MAPDKSEAMKGIRYPYRKLFDRPHDRYRRKLTLSTHKKSQPFGEFTT
jgi:hypothetical protein